MEQIERNFHRFILAGLACATFAIAISYTYEHGGNLEIYFLDIGQGDAIYARTPDGRDVLIDGGPGDAVLRRLSEVMPWYDRRIDVVIATHPDADHIGGLPQVFERYGVGVFLEPGVASENSIDDELSRLRKEKGIESVLARRDMVVNFGDGTFYHILYPDSDVTKFETNAASIVGRLGFGSTSAMLTGDSPKSIENYLVSRYKSSLKSDILKAGHHGSRTSSGETFVKAVSPSYAVISAGRANRYGHPHAEVIDILRSNGAQISDTATFGTIGFTSDGKSVRKK